MFFFGSLTTLFPYALTIIAMFFCIFTGAPMHQQVVSYTRENIQEYSANKSDSSKDTHYHDHKVVYAACYSFHFIPKAQKTCWPLRPLDKQGHVTIAASGNKAPPVFDII